VHERGIEKVGALEAGEGEDDPVELAGFEFADAGVDVAANVIDFQVGANSQQLAAAAEGAGANFRAWRQILDGWGLGRDEHISHVLARRHGRDDEICLLHQRHRHRHVFETVDNEIDLVIEQRLLELADEEALATKLVQGPIGDLVAGSFESCQIDRQRWMDALELVYDELGLGQRKG